jgi:hypothetical protein
MSDYGFGGLANIGRVLTIMAALIPILLTVLLALLYGIRRLSRRTGQANRWLIGLAVIVGGGLLLDLMLLLPLAMR